MKMKTISKKNVTVSIDASTKRTLATATGALSEVATALIYATSDGEPRKRRK